MIAGTYILSGVLLAIAGVVLGDLTAVTLTIFGAVIFFFASAGASAAYLTASEVFPMETRALCIAFFYAIGTAVGGISGPLLFGKLIDDASAVKDITAIAIGYFIGAALMIVGGIVEAVPGRQGRGSVAGEHRPAADRRGRRRPASERQAEPSPPDARREQGGTMPMPPPKPSTEGRRDRQVFHEMGQIVRAVEARAARASRRSWPPSVGATYWEQGRFDRALALAVADGLVVRGEGGMLQASV